jgi:hypothetical protein
MPATSLTTLTYALPLGGTTCIAPSTQHVFAPYPIISCDVRTLAKAISKTHCRGPLESADSEYLHHDGALAIDLCPAPIQPISEIDMLSSFVGVS